MENREDTLTVDNSTYEFSTLDKETQELSVKLAELDTYIYQHEEQARILSTSRQPMLDELKDRLQKFSPIKD